MPRHTLRTLLAPTAKRWVGALRSRLHRHLGLVVCRSGSSWKIQEHEQLARFLAHFDVDCVFDVGANAGQYADRLRQLGFQGLILSFEPNPELVARLQRKASRDAKWVVIPHALDSESRRIDFNIMRDSEFSSLLAPDHSQTDRFADPNSVAASIPVETRTVDQLFGELRAQYGFRRPFLKLDTQGHDAAVVAGAGQSLSNFVGLQSELAFTTLYLGAERYDRTLTGYEQLGFKLTALIPNNAGHFPDLNEIDCLMYNTRLSPDGVDPLHRPRERP